MIDNYDENKSLIETREYFDNYDENKSLIEERKYSHNFYGDGNLLSKAEDKVKTFVKDVLDYYSSFAKAQAKYYELKALNLVENFAQKWAIEEPTKYINSLLYGNKNSPQPEFGKNVPIGYTDTNPYVGRPNQQFYGDETQNNAWARHKMGVVIKSNDGKSISSSYSSEYGKRYEPSSVIEKLKKKSFMFAIKNMATGDLEYFPAYISTFNEGTSAAWNSISLINRSEDVYTYQKSDQNFNMDFIIVATKLDEFGKGTPEQFTVYRPNGSVKLDVVGKSDMWRKMNFLQALMRPLYENGHYIRAPYARLWLGDLYTDQDIIVESINFNYDPLIWDLNDGDIKPMIVTISMGGKILHSTPPAANTDYTYYRRIK